MEIIDIVWAIIVRFAADFVLRIGTAEQSEKRSENAMCHLASISPAEATLRSH